MHTIKKYEKNIQPNDEITGDYRIQCLWEGIKDVDQNENMSEIYTAFTYHMHVHAKGDPIDTYLFYHPKGYFFSISKLKDEEGIYYEFCSGMEPFKSISLDKACKITSQAIQKAMISVGFGYNKLN